MVRGGDRARAWAKKLEAHARARGGAWVLGPLGRRVFDFYGIIERWDALKFYFGSA